MDDELVVYIGAHPDDIDIGMSGSIYKFDVGKHPIMWVVVTDGGADSSEHAYDSKRGWVKNNLTKGISYRAPDGSLLTRENYSEDLVQKRCGIKFNNGSWMPELAQHSSIFGQEFDWRTRVRNLVGEDIEMRQLMYSDYLLYPDGSLRLKRKIFTNSIAENLANEIINCVTSNGYSKDLIYIKSHAPEDVCYNSCEHSDHEITGNAVMEAINLLLNRDIRAVDAIWFTVYDPISPKSGYWKVDMNISSVRHKKSALCKACWETEFMAQPSGGYTFKTWGENNPSEERRYPNNPLEFECGIKMSYLQPFSTRS